MKKIGKSSNTPPPPGPAPSPSPTTPTAPSGSGAGASPGGSAAGSAKGFGAAFRDAVARKFRELTGQKWQKATDAQKRAEAARRGAREMARRIERSTGKRPAESTVRRNARRDVTPKGMDPGRLDRQAAIDRAGGIKPFADKAGLTVRQATKWRDEGGTILVGGPIPTDVIYIVFDVLCDIFHVGPRGITPDYDRRIDNSTDPLNDQDLAVHEPDASSLVEAYASDDVEMLKEILADQLAMSIFPYWAGRPGRTATVKAINTLIIR